MSTIDHIYQRLKAERIEIVDHLPEVKASHSASPSGQKKYHWRYPRRSGGRHRRRKHFQDYQEDEALNQIRLCPEQGIDELLLRWETTGELSDEYFFKVVKKYGFSRLEVSQLVEYLGLLGIDYPENYDWCFSENERKKDQEVLSATCLRRFHYS